MGKGKPKVEVTEYYLSQHFGICLAEPDALLDVLVNEKSIFDETLTDAALVTIDKPDLFGGPTKEGGVGGFLQYLTGADSQFMPSLLAQKLGRSGSDDCPAYRGLASLFFYGPASRGFYWTANAPFVPGVWAKLRRILKRSDGSAQWYPEKAEIDTCGVEAEPELQLRLVLTGLPQTNSVSSATITEPASWAIRSLLSDTQIGNFTTIPESEVDTTDEVLFTTRTPSQRLNFYWRDPELLEALYDREIRLNLQYGAGDINAPSTYTLQYYNPLTEEWQTLIPKPASTVINPGVASEAHTGGVIEAYSLWPTNTYYDLPPAPGREEGGLDMNPAHIIHECLTDREFGMGTPVSALDDAAFRAAADTLYAEKFGLSMLWTRQSEIQKFISEVLDHIKGVIYTDPRTGLLVLKLIRDDYDPATLPVLNPDNADLSGFSRKLWGDIVNEVIVTWTDPANEQEATVIAQDNASIAVQGGIVSTSRNYYGVRCVSLAQKLAFRDLAHDGQPVITCEALVDRTQFAVTPGAVVKLTWPEYGLTELVMRVQEVDYGKPGEPEIKLTLLQDIFGLDVGSFDRPATTAWTDPARPPSVMDPVVIFTMPYFFAVNSSAASFADTPTYPEALAGLLASSPNPDAWEYDLQTDVTLPSGDVRQETVATNNVIGKGVLEAALSREAESALVSFTGLIGGTRPTLGGFALLGADDEETAEIAMITLDNGDGTYTLSRGVLDTVPRSWPSGADVYFLDESTVYEDPTIRAAGEVVEYKLLMRTSKGRLPAASAPVETATLTERAWLPNRPANVRIGTEAFSTAAAPIDRSEAGTDFPVSWANRNRLTEDSQVMTWDGLSVAAEAGQTTRIEVRSLAGALITTHSGLSGSSFDLPVASFGSEEVGEVRFLSERTDSDGTFTSLQYWSEWVRVIGASRQTEPGDARLTETGEQRLIEG